MYVSVRCMSCTMPFKEFYGLNDLCSLCTESYNETDRINKSKQSQLYMLYSIHNRTSYMTT